MVERKIRISAQELPDVHEILEIIRLKESQRRAVRRDFIEVHKDKFSAFRNLCVQCGAPDLYGMDTNIKSEEELSFLVEKQEEMKVAIRDFLNDPNSRLDKRTLQEVFDSLVRADEPSGSNMIFVFGALSNVRVDLAAQLYKDGVADTIMISGRGPNWGDDSVPSEASRMSEVAIQHGVNPSDIILEENAITLPDNVKRSLDVLDERGFIPHKVTIIAANFSLLRARMEWYKYPDEPIEIVAISPEPVNPDNTSARWFLNPESTNLVLNEYAKIFGEVCIDNLLFNENSTKDGK